MKLGFSFTKKKKLRHDFVCEIIRRLLRCQNSNKTFLISLFYVLIINQGSPKPTEIFMGIINKFII